METYSVKLLRCIAPDTRLETYSVNSFTLYASRPGCRGIQGKTEFTLYVSSSSFYSICIEVFVVRCMYLVTSWSCNVSNNCFCIVCLELLYDFEYISLEYVFVRTGRETAKYYQKGANVEQIGAIF